MPDEANLPLVPDDDPVVDRLLGSAGRFSPKRGFEDRVVSRVRVPIPRWLRTIRDALNARMSGVSGWTILATFSLATAAAWTTAAAAGVRYWGEISGAASLVWREALSLAGEVFREGIVPGWELTKAEVSAWLASLGLDPTMTVVGYGIIALVCAVGLKLLTAEPARRRGTINATR
jgi:hypothetical protein